MHPRKSRVESLAAAAGLALACAWAAAVAIAQPEAPRTVRDGVFSAAQVEEGRELFEYICMNCHEIEEFTGVDAYLEEMEGENVWEVFEYVWSEMPEDEPASLDPEEYAAVLAYVFSIYGLPSGEADLPIERKPLEAITITRPSLPGS